jgi:hypothetical protein
MKTIRMSALALLVFAPIVAPAADEPDAVYGRYHRAAAAGNLAEMAQHAQAAQRAELLAMSAAQKSAMVKMLAATMPRAFSLSNKTVSRDGKSARLLVSGPDAAQEGEKPEMLYGTIRMVMEGANWKVGETEWSNSAPAGFAAPAGAKSAVPASAKSVAPVRRTGGGLVGSTASPPERKLGIAKEPCVYKPVMTAEDVENCK